jgi:hypothetical protein
LLLLSNILVFQEPAQDRVAVWLMLVWQVYQPLILELLDMPEFKWMIIIIEGLIFVPVLDVTLFNMRCHDIRLDYCLLSESC